MASDIQLIIDYKNGNIKAVAGEAENTLGKSGKKAGEKFSRGFEISSKGILKGIAKIATAATAIGGVTLFKTVKDAAQLETISTQFEVILGSAKAAQGQIEELQDFAATTPFQLPGLAAATRQLLSFGIAQKEIIPTMRQLGDLAAATGSQIDELVIPYGRLRSTQRLSLIELDKFADRGINIYQALADQTGGSLKTIRKDIENQRISYDQFQTALNSLTNEGGIFFGATEKRARTLTGVISTMGDNFFNLTSSIGKAFSPLIIDVIDKITKAMQELTKFVRESFNVFDDVINPILAVNDALITYVAAPLELVGNIGRIVFNSIVAGVAQLVANFGTLGGVIGSFLKKFNIAEGLAQGLEDFSETSKATADEARKDLADAFTSVVDFPISDKLATKNEDLRSYFQEQRAIIEEEGQLTSDSLTIQTEQAAEQSRSFADMLIQTFGKVKIGINKTKEEMAKVAQQTARIIKNGLAKGIAGGIQNIVNSLAKGEDVFANFGKFLLNTIGDLAIQLGQFFIAEGIAVEALNAVSGTGAIAAGAALVALGTLLKSFSGGGSGAGAGAGGGSAASPSFDASDEPTGEFLEETGAATPQTIVNFNIDGNVKGDEEFIRDTVASIGEEAGKQGLVFDNFATT